MSPRIKNPYSVFKSELVYTIIICIVFFFWFNTDQAKQNIIPGWLPYLKSINVIVIWVSAVFSAKKVIDLRSGAKKIIEKGDLESED